MASPNSILDQIKQSSPRARLVVGVAAVLLLAIFGLAGLVASKPHFVTLYSGLDDAQRVSVERALAEGSVKFQVSMPPAPFAVYVDEGSIYDAQKAVALAGALERAATGISPANDGKTAIFQSSGERSQAMMKRGWQELEQLLLTLDFVRGARVTTSHPETSPLRRSKPLTVAVTLKLKGISRLSAQQAETVAKLVQYCFDTQPENIVIADQQGNALYGLDGGDNDVDSFLEKTRLHDVAAQDEVNKTLALAYGDKKAIVTVKSEWSRDKRVVLSQQVDPKARAANREEETKKETPQGGAPVGGPAGTASNLGQGGQGAGGSGGVATTKETSKTFDTSKQTTQTVEDTPRLQRLSVAVLVDESIADQMASIEDFVKKSVGFNEQRTDDFSIGTTTFVVSEDGAGEGEVTEGPGGPSPMVQMLIERSVELLVAGAFIVLLLKSLKRGGGKEDAKTTAGGSGAGSVLPNGQAVGADGVAEADVDPELIARMQIEDLVQSDPRRVGEILSAWARDEKAGAGAG